MKSLFNITFIYCILFLSFALAVFPLITFMLNMQEMSPYIYIIATSILLYIIGLISGQLTFPSDLYYKIFLIIVLIITFSFFYNLDNKFAERKYFLFMSNGFLLTFFFGSINKDYLYKVAQGIIIFSIIQTIVIISFWYTLGGYEIRWFIGGKLHIDTILLSRVIGLGIIVTYIISKKYISIIFIPYLLFFMILLNEVGPILSVFLILSLYNLKKYEDISFGFALILSILIIFLAPKVIPDLQLNSMEVDPRIDIYTTNIDYFLNNPIIGIGIAGQSKIIGYYQSAHNIFIEIASEYGLIGLLPFIVMVVLLFKKFFEFKFNLWGYLWLYSFFIVQFSGDISTNSVFWIFSTLFILETTPIQNDIYLLEIIS